MLVALCIDNRGGMLFNHRRLSRDRAQLEDLRQRCGGKPLFIAPFSEKLFSQWGGEVTVSEHFLEEAGGGELCFVEDRSLRAVEESIEGLLLYRWNRDYPADLFFDLNLAPFTLRERREFPGSSHETITLEIYERRKKDGKEREAKEAETGAGGAFGPAGALGGRPLSGRGTEEL